MQQKYRTFFRFTSPFWPSVKCIQRRRVPQRLQLSTTECGAACLAMILSYYGCQTSIAEIRMQCDTGRDGLSAQSILSIAKKYGMRVKAISLQNNDFRCIQLPVIIHWEFNHFVILERWSPKRVTIVDPALGYRRVTAQEFDGSFTGVVILLEPGEHFIRHRSSTRTHLRSSMASCIKQAPWAFVQILITSLFLQLFGLGIPLLTVLVVDRIIPFQRQAVMPLLGAGIVVLLLSQLVTTLLRDIVLIHLQVRVDKYFMLRFFEHLILLPLRFFEQRSSGDILSRLNSNTVVRDTLSQQLVSTILDGSFVTVYLAILLWQSRLFGLLVLGIGLLQILLLSCTNRQIHSLTTSELMAQSRSQSYATETVTGITTLKAAGAERRALEHWSRLFFEHMNISVRLNMFLSCIEALMTMLHTFSPLALLWVGTIMVLNGTLHVGTMLALNALAMAFLTPLASLVSSGQSLQMVHAHLERISDVMKAETEQQAQSVQQPSRLTGRIRLEQVCFSYDAQSPNVLHNISIHIEPGQKVAIVGRTGSGKSTLGKLLLGLHHPTQGEILYDDIPLQVLDYQAVRAQFGAVMQDATIFSGSIRQNIAFNHPDMTMERIIQAAQTAALHNDVKQMPMEYETFVSERGGALSGGQRQRLALARALAHNPALLLLDEATSALDVLTEKVVEQNMNALACTQIIITHRLSTFCHADVILVLEQGTIVEKGTHQELLSLDGYYAKLIQCQLMQEAL